MEINGKHIVITGTLSSYRRAEAFALIRMYGGMPQDTVTHDTDILVVGYYREGTLIGEKSHKRLTAERYIEQGQNIRIINEVEFLRLIWTSFLS